jgi:hypothetical protein
LKNNTAYSLWRVNGCQQGFRSVASFGFGGQESASKPPQAICKPLGGYENELMYYKKGGQSEGTPIALGLNKLHLEPIELYPNPSSSYIIIDNVSQEFDYAIHSVTSEKVQGGKSSKKIDTSELESGVYYLEIISDDKRLVGKFIKE